MNLMLRCNGGAITDLTESGLDVRRWSRWSAVPELSSRHLYAGRRLTRREKSLRRWCLPGSAKDAQDPRVPAPWRPFRPTDLTRPARGHEM